MKREIQGLRAERDRRIDDRCGGLYSMIVESVNHDKKVFERLAGVPYFEHSPKGKPDAPFLSGLTNEQRERKIEEEPQQYF
jgi:hypothetical protein